MMSGRVRAYKSERLWLKKAIWVGEETAHAMLKPTGQLQISWRSVSGMRHVVESGPYDKLGLFERI